VSLQIVILAGGLGTRLGHLTHGVPKPMISLAGKPFLEWQILFLAEQGFKDFLVLSAYLADQISYHFADGGRLGVNIKYSVEPSPLGTGGAVKYALDHIDDNFILINGDSFLPLVINDKIPANLKNELSLLALTALQACPVEPNLCLKNDFITKYERNIRNCDGRGAVDAGIYFCNKFLIEGALKKLEDRFSWDLVLSQFASNKMLKGIAISTPFYDIGTPERLTVFEDYLRKRI
jgi:NDP-sugar pyrophosphorylase family protein